LMLKYWTQQGSTGFRTTKPLRFLLKTFQA
jgi:hypothetical protein